MICCIKSIKVEEKNANNIELDEDDTGAQSLLGVDYEVFESQFTIQGIAYALVMEESSVYPPVGVDGWDYILAYSSSQIRKLEGITL